MPKSKESIADYNREYFARPEVVAHAKVRNAERRHVRKAYKKSEAGKRAELKYRQTDKYRAVERRRRLRFLYKTTPEIIDALKVLQQGLCAICQHETAVLHIDHCHENNKVRGLLCGSCNRGLGMFKDNPELLKAAAEYLGVPSNNSHKKAA